MAQTLEHNKAVTTVVPVSIPTFDDDLAIIQKLDDEPNDVGGLTAMELKAKFDEGNVTAQQYINNVLIPAVVADDLTEQTRAAAEAERVANEIERVASETNRLSAENTRVTNEANRVIAEAAREQAEQARVDSTNGIVAQASASARYAAESAFAADNSAAEATRQVGIASAYAASAEQFANNAAAAANGADNSRAEAEASAGQAGAHALEAARSETEALRYSKIAQSAAADAKGDMLKSVYDPTGKRTDIFGYVDTQIAGIPKPDLSKTLSFEANNAAEAVTAALPTAAAWRLICRGDDRFVAIAYGTNIAAYSDDGVTWTQTTMPRSANWEYLAYGNGRFVATTESSYVAYSIDGITWTEVEMPLRTSAGAIAYGAGKFVMIGYYMTTNYALTSTDGVTWTRAGSLSRNNWLLTYGGSRFVAISYQGNVGAYSDDGVTWTETEIPNAAWSTPVYGNGAYVAADGASGGAMVSKDGVTWSSVAALPSESYCGALAFGDGKFVVLPYEGTTAAYSTDGYTWTEMTISTYSAWWAATYGAGKFVAVASESTMTTAVSTDGINWSTSYALPNALFQNGADVTEAVKDALGVGGSGGGVFLAVYNETSYEDVLAAYNEGKMIFCKDTRTSYSFENIYVLSQYMTGSGFTFTQADTGLTYGRSSYYINPLKVLTLSVSNGWHEPATAKPYLPAIYMDGADGNEYMITVNASGQLVATAT